MTIIFHFQSKVLIAAVCIMCYVYVALPVWVMVNSASTCTWKPYRWCRDNF